MKNTVFKGVATALITPLTENGIEEEGSHKELIAKGGIYKKLYEGSAE